MEDRRVPHWNRILLPEDFLAQTDDDAVVFFQELADAGLTGLAHVLRVGGGIEVVRVDLEGNQP